MRRSRITRIYMHVLQYHASAAELHQFSEVIHAPTTHGTLVCLDEAATPLSRIWCLHELDHTFRAGGDKLHLLTQGELIVLMTMMTMPMLLLFP